MKTLHLKKEGLMGFEELTQTVSMFAGRVYVFLDGLGFIQTDKDHLVQTLSKRTERGNAKICIAYSGGHLYLRPQ